MRQYRRIYVDIANVISNYINNSLIFWLLSYTKFNLQELQNSVIGIPRDLILPEDQVDEIREQRQKSIRKIVEMYKNSRKNNRVFKHTYDALNDPNPFVRTAAVDVIGISGNKNSFEYLFKALEDEEFIHVKKRIVSAIDQLESKIRNLRTNTKDATITDAMRILSFTK